MAVFAVFALLVLGAVHGYMAWHFWQAARYVLPRLPLKVPLVAAGLMMAGEVVRHLAAVDLSSRRKGVRP